MGKRNMVIPAAFNSFMVWSMVRPEPVPPFTHHIFPAYISIGAPLGLLASLEGSWRPSKPNQLPQRAGNNCPSLVRLPCVFTRNTPAPGLILELEDVTELDELGGSDDELERELLEGGNDELERELLDGGNDDELETLRALLPPTTP